MKHRLLQWTPLLVLFFLATGRCLGATGDASVPSDTSASGDGNQDGQSKDGVKSRRESLAHFGVDLEFSPTKFPNYTYTPSVQSSKNGYELHVGFEWLPIRKYGKLGFGISSGFFVAPNVPLSVNPATGETQVATLYVIPISAYFSYRFDYKDPGKQVLVPFLKAGPNLSLVIQRSYFQYAKGGIATYTGLEYGGGLEFCLNWLEPSAAAALDRSTGIAATYIVFEYMRSSAIGLTASSPDLSGYQFRLGFRFET